MNKLISATPYVRFGRNYVTSGWKNDPLLKFKAAERLNGIEKNVWIEFIQLAIENKPLNLGQGFPDFNPPQEVTNALSDVGKSDDFSLHQYTRGFGHPRLINILSKLYSKLVSQDINPNTEVLVTAGAYEALFCSILGNINPGDEVIIIEPYFDCYEPMVRLAHGIPVFVSLRPKSHGTITDSENWTLDLEELKAAFSTRTKAIILNTPHNPLGKVFSRNELELLSQLVQQWNVLVISDEVYEWMVYPPKEHIRFGIIYDYLPALVHQHCLYTCATPIQEAVACNLEKQVNCYGTQECYLQSLAKELLPKRELLSNILQDTGFHPVIPEAGYFMMADWTKLDTPVSEQHEAKDYKFVKWMSRTWKLQCIPCSAFYHSQHQYLGEQFIRFCFIKNEDTLLKAKQILKKLKATYC